ncbi:hypothetical protein [Nonomuraea sp. SYSU D8015]|uniref:hypothetical protein n=1 Tax=Nonomuraea sp. SYSU D8015 TaxID=2593644 RepID=UPI001660AD32|nr:hypothetical protein [Nonomuraea sp. SYSU D8015]
MRATLALKATAHADQAGQEATRRHGPVPVSACVGLRRPVSACVGSVSPGAPVSPPHVALGR